MPHFYCHLWRGGQPAPDEVGLSLPTLDAAKRRAESIASSIIDQGECAPGSLSSWDIEITDHAGRTFLVVPVGKRSGSVASLRGGFGLDRRAVSTRQVAARV